MISCFLQFKSLLLFLSPCASQTVSKPNSRIFFVTWALGFSACSAPPWGILGHLLRRDADLLSEPQPKGRATTVLCFLPSEFHHPHGSPIETDSLSTSANALTQTNNSRVDGWLQVAYPFGHGLSYTTFHIRCLAIPCNAHFGLGLFRGKEDCSTACGGEGKGCFLDFARKVAGKYIHVIYLHSYYDNAVHSFELLWHSLCLLSAAVVYPKAFI